MRGLVIKNTGNTYWVRTENGEEIVCQAKGSFRLKGIRSTSPIVVGDYVTIDKNPDGTAFITEIEDRKIISSAVHPTFPNKHTFWQQI